MLVPMTNEESIKKSEIPSVSNDKDLTASDLQKASGMSYRQLNSWDEKGAIPESRDQLDRWRKFTPNTFFTILICKELRDKFGVSFEALRRLQRKFEEDGAEKLQHTLQCITGLGYSVCLLTDLKDEFFIDTDLEVSNLLRAGLLRKKNANDYIILRLSPLVNKVLELIKQPPLPDGEEWYEKLFELLGQTFVKNDAEFHLLSLVRSKEFRSITIHLKNGQIYQTDTYEELGEKMEDAKDLLKIIKEKQHQSISIDLTGGEVIRVTRKSPKKYTSKETEKS